MIIETKVHTCRKCHSKDLTKNSINVCGSQQYHSGSISICQKIGAMKNMTCTMLPTIMSRSLKRALISPSSRETHKPLSKIRAMPGNANSMEPCGSDREHQGDREENLDGVRRRQEVTPEYAIGMNG